MTAIPTQLPAVVSALTAVVGLYVAYLAYDGYRKTDSSIMRALAAGVLAIAVIPFLISGVLRPSLGLTDAQALVGVLTSHTLGLLAIYWTFRA